MPINNKQIPQLEVRFIDIDPDTGTTNQDECICLVQYPDDGIWIGRCLKLDNPFPNREFYVFDPTTNQKIKI